ncbi:MAG TPA: NBR1-Ig-like domain-containing protein, partial [Thermoanaerobaculia bacterium]
MISLGLASRPAGAQDGSPYGVDIHSPTGAELTLDLDRVQAAGIGWVHVAVIWPYVEGQQGVFDWSAYDEIVAAAQARHLGILATILYTPAWATAAPTWIGVPDQGAWANFCRAAAARYKGSIRYWGLWNEPNLAEFWEGSRQQYIDVILKAGADAIHAGNPDAQVGGPALAHLTSAKWYDWLTDVLAKAGDRLDFVTHHVYDSSGNGGVTSKLNDSTVFGGTPGLWGLVAPSVREVLENSSWFGRPFWLTETGWQTSEVGESRQAQYYTGFLDDWFTGQHRQDWIAKVFFYEIKDPASGTPTWGLLKPDGTPKMCYAAYRDFIAGRQPPPPPPPPPPAQTDGATLVASDIPNTMEAGQAIAVSLTFKNTGSTAWTAGANYKLGAPGDTDPFAPARQLLAAGESIAPGAQRTFTFPYTAPLAPGSYATHWQMLREGVAWFGGELTQTVAVNPAPAPVDRTLELFGRRFSVAVSWLDPASGHAGFGRAVPGSDETGSFWFFSAANLELVVKALDGRAVNGHYWLFYGALSDVEYWVTVTDLATGAVKTYHNPHGNLCGRGDTSAFSDAPATKSAALALPGTAVDGPASPAGLAGEGAWIAVPLPETGAPVGFASAAAATCAAGPQDLCLLGDRFRVSVRWHTPQGASGDGQATPV